jgi:undecaprenyl-diphosphatase
MGRWAGVIAGVGLVAAALLVPAPPGLNALQAAILGLVEGLTEYLPVSSTGHLLLAQHLMGLGAGAEEAMHAYEIVIQAGAILAVLLLYGDRVRGMLDGLLGRNPAGRTLARNVVAAFVPAAVIGILFGDAIKAHLFGMWPVTAAWLVGGVVILIVARRQRATNPDGNLGTALEELSLPQALGIGGLQCVAMWPGVSRSFATILGGLLVGLSPVAAVEFSFLLGLITLTAATLKDAVAHGQAIVATFGIINPLIGFAVATVAAVVSVQWMVGYLNRRGLAVFGYYRLALGAVVAALLLLQWVK